MFATAAPVLFAALDADVVADWVLLLALVAVLTEEAVVWLLFPAAVVAALVAAVVAAVVLAVVGEEVVSALPLDVVVEVVESLGNNAPAHS